MIVSCVLLRSCLWLELVNTQLDPMIRSNFLFHFFYMEDVEEAQDFPSSPSAPSHAVEALEYPGYLKI